MAIGSSKKTSLVQCNIGTKSPVLLCALLPDKNESLQLNLEFEEADEVVFSVIGPRGVYLTGYYLGHSRHSNFDDDSYPFVVWKVSLIGLLIVTLFLSWYSNNICSSITCDEYVIIYMNHDLIDANPK